MEIQDPFVRLLVGSWSFTLKILRWLQVYYKSLINFSEWVSKWSLEVSFLHMSPKRCKIRKYLYPWTYLPLNCNFFPKVFDRFNVFLSVIKKKQVKLFIDFLFSKYLRFPAIGYLFKVNNRNKKNWWNMFKVNMKTPEWRHWRRSGVFIVNSKTFHNLFWCFYYWFWTVKLLLGFYE